MKNIRLRTFFIFSFVFIFAITISSCPEEIDIPDGMEITTNKTGTHNGYDYEFWSDSRGAGSGRMILAGGGNFYCEWKNTYNILFRMGKKFGSTQTHSQVGNIVLEYGMDGYSPTGTSYATVYGWTQNPLVEFYIVENWGSNGYKGGGGASLGSVSVNGGTYDIYRTQRVSQPSIEGDTTFYQYWSIRRSGRSSGTIDISEHFKAWQSKGLNMNGKLYEVAFCIEAYGGNAKDASGKANVTKNRLLVNGVEVNN